MISKENVVLLKNYGFCYGVNHSIKIVLETIKNKSYPRPIYLLNSIVHNKFVNDYFINEGVIILEGKPKLELLNDITEGTIIFSAHGVGDNIKEKAKRLNLTIVDATCPFVEKSYQLIKKYLNDGYHLLYIGKKNHPEVESVLSFSPNVSLITNDLPEISSSNPLAIAHQTTMSDYDVDDIYQKIKEKVPNVQVLPMLCNATQLRQNELKSYLVNNCLDNTLVIVVGDKLSNNCTKLFELSQRYTKNTIFIDDYLGLSNYDLSPFTRFVISSGTSTPIICVQNIVNYLTGKRIIKSNDLSTYIK